MSEGLGEAARKTKKRRLFTKKRLGFLLLSLLLFSAGAAFQHYYVEPVISEGIAGKYSLCLTQKQVLDSRFADCREELQDVNNLYRACSYNLEQCQAT